MPFFSLLLPLAFVLIFTCTRSLAEPSHHQDDALVHTIADRVADCQFCFEHAPKHARLCTTFAQLFMLPSMQRQPETLGHIASAIHVDPSDADGANEHLGELSIKQAERNKDDRCRLLHATLLSPPYDIYLGEDQVETK